MPTTRELVSIIKEDFAPDWGIPKLLQFLDRAQRFLYKNDCAETVWLNESDPSFPYPIFKTTSGVLSYDMSPTNLVDSEGVQVTPEVSGYPVHMRRIRSVFIVVSDLASSNYDKKFYGEQFSLVGLNQFWSQRLYRTSFYKVPGDIHDANGLHDYPRFVFHEDPGTTTDRYFVEMFCDPIEITSANIPLTIDGDKWEDALIDGVVGYIEDIESGKSERLEKFRKYWLKKFMSDANDHADERTSPKMLIRECL
jgi:hypothetical protein